MRNDYMGSKNEFNFITLSVSVVVVVVVVAEVVFQSIDFSPFLRRGKNALEKLIDSIIFERRFGGGRGGIEQSTLPYSNYACHILTTTFITWTNRSENTSLQRKQKRKIIGEWAFAVGLII